MNEQTCSELRLIQDRQSRLESEVRQLRDTIVQLETRLQKASASGTSLERAVAQPGGTSMRCGPVVTEPPPVIPGYGLAARPAPGPKVPDREKVVTGTQTAAEGVQPLKAARAIAQDAAPALPRQEALRTDPGQPESSFEMRLGTYWLVRLGIVMVLTALVFFGNLAYHQFISNLGAAGKVILLYVASFGLLGAGTFWLQRSSREALKNYAQVLFAGGLAAVYFTTFAAHHFPNLRVIHSPLIDGILLLGWAGFMVWVADRKKSEVLALFAVALAYYTSVITRVGYFTLYSNLLLTIAAVFFLVRNRWATLSFASLVATYGAYAFWRFFQDGVWTWAEVDKSLWAGSWLLMAYWALFTAAVFLARTDRLFGSKRAAFLTFNNGAFLACFLLTMFLVREGGLWRVLVTFGLVLLALAAAATKFLRTDLLARNAYLVQGLVLVTLGIIAKFSGMTLALMLAGESVVLLYLGQQRRDSILLVGAFVSAGLSVLWGMDGFARNDRPSMYLGAGLGALMLANAVLRNRADGKPQAERLSGSVMYFAGLALLTWGFATWHNTSAAFFPVMLALEALLLTMTVYVLRVREVAVLAQGLLLSALFMWATARAGGDSAPWWGTAVVLATTLGLSHWWQRQNTMGFQGLNQLVTGLQTVYALAITGLLLWWFAPNVPKSMLMVWASGLGLAVTAYGAASRFWPLAASAQLLLLPAIAIFLGVTTTKEAAWYQALAPIAGVAVIQSAAMTWLSRHREIPGRVTEPVSLLCSIYRWVAVLLCAWWVEAYIPAQSRPLVATLLGAALFVWGLWKTSREPWLMSAVLLLQALVHIWAPGWGADSVTFRNLLAIVTVLALQRAARIYQDRLGLDERAHAAVILAGGLTLWLFVSQWVLESQSGFYLTASWSILALTVFLSGFLFREKVYRWLGLGILACALGRVILFDVWKLETLYRILSFLALGVVLLVLGYVYSRFQDKIRQWL